MGRSIIFSIKLAAVPHSTQLKSQRIDSIPQRVNLDKPLHY